MAEAQNILEYKCPCCGAGLLFGEETQKMKCEYCDNQFEMDAVKAYNESLDDTPEEKLIWQQASFGTWAEGEESSLVTYICQSCGGALVTDENTAATFCPYCENPTILPGRLSGSIRPDKVIPFKTGKEDAMEAFLNLCKGKPLLPKMFTQQQRVEKITGIYVPFWLYDCSGTFEGKYKATRVRHWMDSRYSYTKTDHYLLARGASADFTSIPMDGSAKMDNAIMESIEPFDLGEMVDFDTAYLSGFFADKYDVEAEAGHERIRQRVSETIDEMLQSSFVGYTSVIPTQKHLDVTQGTVKYALFPIWMLHTKYKDKTYVFAMNGQTGKMTGSFPICLKRSLAWFTGICAGVTAVVSLLTMVL